MTHVTCRLTAKNRDQLRNPTLGNRVWATFTLPVGNESAPNWHNAGSLGWPFSVLKYKKKFQINYTEAILTNSTRKQLWFKITKLLTAV